MYAEVLVDLPARPVDRTFHYLVPAHLQDRVAVGSRVQVPFGRQKLAGYVLGFSAPPELDRVKEIGAVLETGPVFDDRQLALARWLAASCYCPTVSALQAVIGPRLAGAPGRVQGLWPAAPALPDPAQAHSLASTQAPGQGPGQAQAQAQAQAQTLAQPQTQAQAPRQAPPDFSRAPAQERAWRTALAQPGLTRRELAAAAGVSPGAVEALLAKKILIVREHVKSSHPRPEKNEAALLPPLPLTPQQDRAVREIQAALQAGEHRVFLLYGVTGSGKTEVYCQSAARALEQGRGAIVLVPEIALTPQMIAVFRARFGQRVAVLHSRLADGERYAEWTRIADGEAGVVLGARSALFAPLREPGLIIVDEEHEPSYKQEENPRYHARTVAQHLARRHGAAVVLGSATPALESFFAAERGEYRLLRLDERIENRPLPRVRVVDLREEQRRGNRGFFSRPLLAAVRERLARREQVILFLNRRGFSTIVVCRECGLAVKCPHCDVSLTYHTGGRLLCHYCNHTAPAPAACPECGSKQIGYFGAGTQKIEQEARRLFPRARVLRLDSDTAARKGAHREILDTFRQGGADILIGTQMVAKGLDIPAVTLVGVVNADLSLHMPDFRAGERTFQLLTQVAGRAGRGDLGGEALIQTYQPEHYAVCAARAHDYEGFYRQEIEYRRALDYPPFSRLARLLVTGPQAAETEGAINVLYSKLKECTGRGRGEEEEIRFLGPAPAPLSRVKDYYRWHLVIKAAREEPLRAAAAAALEAADRFTSRRLRVIIDIEPQNLI